MRILFVFSLLAAAAIAQEAAPKHELAFHLGGFVPLSKGPVDLTSGVAMQANYGRRIAEFRNVALYAEVHMLASPQRLVETADQRATRDVASLYVTPGLRLKLFPKSMFSPYVAAGGGLAWYEQSRTQLNGQSNAASREAYTGAFDFGGGVDVRVWRYLALRGEIRDFVTGLPAYNLSSVSGAQNNVVAGAAFVIRWK